MLICWICWHGKKYPFNHWTPYIVGIVCKGSPHPLKFHYCYLGWREEWRWIYLKLNKIELEFWWVYWKNINQFENMFIWWNIWNKCSKQNHVQKTRINIIVHFQQNIFMNLHTIHKSFKILNINGNSLYTIVYISLWFYNI